MTSRMDVIGQNGNDALAYQSEHSSMTNRQKRQVALDIGRCSDGRPCGEVHEFCQDAYCEDCPNDPVAAAIDTGICSSTGRSCGSFKYTQPAYCPDCPNDPLSDMTVSAKPTAHKDNVNHPPHYQSEDGIECIDAIKAQMSRDQFVAYCQGNAVKYLWRWRSKGGVESLDKARWYLDRMIEELE